MKALLLIDIQNGFCPGGNLAVADGEEPLPAVREDDVWLRPTTVVHVQDGLYFRHDHGGTRWRLSGERVAEQSDVQLSRARAGA